MVTTKAICLEQIVQIWDDGLQTHFNSIRAKCEIKCRWRRPYGGYHYVQTIVGSLIYMTITKPDLSYVVGMVSQFMQTQWKPHLDAMRRILRYINIFCSVGIFYEAKNQLQIHGYTDADWAGNVSNKRSTSGFMFFF